MPYVFNLNDHACGTDREHYPSLILKVYDYGYEKPVPCFINKL